MKFHPSFISIGLMFGGWIGAGVSLLVEGSDPPGLFFGIGLIVMLIGVLSMYATASSLGRDTPIPTDSPNPPGSA